MPEIKSLQLRRSKKTYVNHDEVIAEIKKMSDENELSNKYKDGEVLLFRYMLEGSNEGYEIAAVIKDKIVPYKKVYYTLSIQNFENGQNLSSFINNIVFKTGSKQVSIPIGNTEIRDVESFSTLMAMPEDYIKTLSNAEESESLVNTAGKDIVLDVSELAGEQLLSIGFELSEEGLELFKNNKDFYVFSKLNISGDICDKLFDHEKSINENNVFLIPKSYNQMLNGNCGMCYRKYKL